MEKSVRCDCGHVVRAHDAAQLVADAQKHARDTHRMELRPELILAIAHASQALSTNQREGTSDVDSHQ